MHQNGDNTNMTDERSIWWKMVTCARRLERPWRHRSFLEHPKCPARPGIRRKEKNESERVDYAKSPCQARNSQKRRLHQKQTVSRKKLAKKERRTVQNSAYGAPPFQQANPYRVPTPGRRNPRGVAPSSYEGRDVAK